MYMILHAVVVMVLQCLNIAVETVQYSLYSCSIRVIVGLCFVPAVSFTCPTIFQACMAASPCVWHASRLLWRTSFQWSSYPGCLCRRRGANDAGPVSQPAGLDALQCPCGLLIACFSLAFQQPP